MNNMKLIMENWRGYTEELNRQYDLDSIKESKMFIKRSQKSLSENKNLSQYAEIMSFYDFDKALTEGKITLNRAEKIYNDTIEYEGSRLDEVSLAGIGSAIKTGAQKVASAGKTALNVGKQVVSGATTAAAKAIIDFVKKVLWGGLKLLSSGVVAAMRNPKIIFPTIKKLVPIGVSLLKKIVQYVKDNKWKIIGTIAAVTILTFLAATCLHMPIMVAFGMVRTIKSCGGAALQVAKVAKGAFAAKAAGAAAGAATAGTAAAGALSEGAAGLVCRAAGNFTEKGIIQMLNNSTRGELDSLKGALMEGQTHLSMTRRLVAVQGQTTTDAGVESTTDSQALIVLAGKAEQARIRAIQAIDSFQEHVASGKDTAALLAEDAEVKNLLATAAKIVQENDCKDPAANELLASVGSHLKISETAEIKAETIIQTISTDQQFWEHISDYADSTVNTTIDVVQEAKKIKKLNNSKKGSAR